MRLRLRFILEVDTTRTLESAGLDHLPTYRQTADGSFVIHTDTVSALLSIEAGE